MKPITLTQEAKDRALDLFKKLLEEANDTTGLKISITPETLVKMQNVEKPIVYITTTAYIKMTALIQNSDKELAWYGVAKRVLHNYLIEDILVYPQTVTSATVDADEAKCAKWFMELPDDIINNLCFQGHSHVTMGASPSGRDTDNWRKFANLLKPGEFYILCIGNKRGEFYWNIYDAKLNVQFENSDITMCVIDDKGNSIADWAKDNISKYIIAETPKVYSSVGFLGDYHDSGPIQTPRASYVVSNKNKKDNITYKEALEYIPEKYSGDIEYELEADVYIAYLTNIPHFKYNYLYQCYTCEGETFRAKYPKQNKKENKTGKKGGNKK